MLIIAPDKETAEKLGGTDAKFHSQFLREETEFLIPAKRGLGGVMKGGAGSGENEGHPFRGNQYTDREGSGEKEKPKRSWSIKRDLNERAQRAKETYVPVTMDVRDGAMAVQQQIATVIPEARNIPGTKPFDVHVGPEGKVRHLIEVKTIWKAKNDKVTVHPPALRRKKEEMERHPKAQPSMVIVDERVKPAKVYYREGVGSFRFGTMTYLGEKRGDKIEKRVLQQLAAIYGGRGVKGGPGSGEQAGHPFRGNQYTEGGLSFQVEKVGNESYRIAAIKDGKEVGSLHVLISPDGLAETDQLSTDKESRRQGIMTALHDYIINSGMANRMNIPAAMTPEGDAFFQRYKRGRSFIVDEEPYYPPEKSIKGGPGSGEHEGHPFRGNQYTTGAESDAEPSSFPTVHWQESDVTPTYDHLADLPYESGEVRSNVDKDLIQMHDIMRRSVLQFSKEQKVGEKEMGLALVNGDLKEGESLDSAVRFDKSYTQKIDHMIHNHPSGCPFSSSDICNMWLRANQKSMEVITPAGTVYRLEKLRNVGVRQEQLALRMKKYWDRKRNELKAKYKDNKEALIKEERGAMRGTPLYIKELDTLMRRMAKTFKDDMRYSVTTFSGAVAKSFSYLDDIEPWDDVITDYTFDETFDDDRMLDPWFEEEK